MMEIHNLYFDFELPWWNIANIHPRLHLPKTMEYVEANFREDEFRMRLNLIKRGINAGRDELIKITRRYLFQVPIVFLVICNAKRGPDFLRSVLSVLYENQGKVPGVVLVHDADNNSKWGQFKYDNPDDRPKAERDWYNLLTKSDDAIDDLIHWWQQLCLNWEILVDDLQRLSKHISDDDESVKGYAQLNKFKTYYPVLFDCLYSVFGTMLSNSRLCEQIHGMMRHGLRIQVGMEQSDHQRIYNSGIDHEMKEERRNMAEEASDFRDKHKKAKKHASTKDQHVRLSQQVVERARAFALMMKEDPPEGNIPTILEINKKGRRVMDKENLDNQMKEEDEKAGGLRRRHLTPAIAMEMAEKTTLTNDVGYVADSDVLQQHERIPQLLRKKRWDVPSAEMNDALDLACEVFPRLIIGDKNGLKLKTKKAKKAVIDNHIDFINEYGQMIRGWVGDLGGFEDKGVHKMDVYSLFVNPVDGAFEKTAEMVMAPVEEALVMSCTEVDPHYTYSAPTQNDSGEEIGDYIDENESDRVFGDDIDNEFEPHPFVCD